MKKKYFALMFVVVFMVSILSGCGGSKLSGYYSRDFRATGADHTDFVSFDGSKFTLYKDNGNGRIYAGTVKDGENKDTWELYITEDDQFYPFAEYCPITVTIIDDNNIQFKWSGDTGMDDTWKKVEKDVFTERTRHFGEITSGTVTAE